MDNNENKVMEPETTPEEAKSEEYRDCDTTETQKASEGLTLKKVVIIAGTVIGVTYVVNKAKPHVKKWWRNRCAAYVEKYDREEAEAAEEVVCESYTEEVDN